MRSDLLYKRSVVVLKDHGHINNRHRQGSAVNDDNVRSKWRVALGDLTVGTDDARNPWHRIGDTVDDVVMAQLTGVRVLQAAAQHMRQRLERMRAATAGLWPVTKATSGVEWDAVKTGAMNEPPISESCADASANKVVRVVPATRDVNHLSLVRFGDKFEAKGLANCFL